MKRQVNVLLALAGAMLLGCTQDPVGTAPGGLEPSASSQRSEDRDDTSPGGGPGDSRPGGESSQSGESGSSAGGSGSDGGSVGNSGGSGGEN
jgi:hypothetical protein